MSWSPMEVKIICENEKELGKTLARIKERYREIAEIVRTFFPICPRCGRAYSCVQINTKYWKRKRTNDYMIRVYIGFKHSDGTICYWGSGTYFKRLEIRQIDAISGLTPNDAMLTLINTLERYYKEMVIATKIWRTLGDDKRAVEVEIECFKTLKRLLKEILRFYVDHIFAGSPELLCKWIRENL